MVPQNFLQSVSSMTRGLVLMGGLVLMMTGCQSTQLGNLASQGLDVLSVATESEKSDSDRKETQNSKHRFGDLYDSTNGAKHSDPNRPLYQPAKPYGLSSTFSSFSSSHDDCST